MSKIDTEGAYRGTVTEAAVGETKKGFPQYIVRLQATAKWCESASEVEAYGLTEPGWVDWTEFDEGITAFLVLCNDEKPLLNYEQVMAAFGWDGVSFAGLAELDVTDREIMFRVEENEYNNEVRMQVNWVDDKDAPIARELTGLSEDKLSGLDDKFSGMLKKPEKAKPAAAAAKPKSKADAKKTTKKKTTKKAPAKKPPATKPPKKEVEEDDIPFESEADSGSGFGNVPDAPDEAQMHVWEIVSTNKGDNSDAEIGEAWVEACAEVGGDKEESDFTVADWVAVGGKVVSGLDLTIE